MKTKAKKAVKKVAKKPTNGRRRKPIIMERVALQEVAMPTPMHPFKHTAEIAQQRQEECNNAEFACDITRSHIETLDYEVSEIRRRQEELRQQLTVQAAEWEVAKVRLAQALGDVHMHANKANPYNKRGYGASTLIQGNECSPVDPSPF